MPTREADVDKKNSKRHMAAYSVHGIFCEDVRQEVSGSATYVGVFPANLILDQFPVTFPRLAAVGWISWPVGLPSPEDIRAEVRMPHGTVWPEHAMALPEIPPPLPGLGRMAITCVVSSAFVTAEQAGLAQFLLKVNGVSFQAAVLHLQQRSSPNG